LIVYTLIFLLADGGVAGVIFTLASLAVLAGETQDDQQTEANEEGGKSAQADPVALSIETVVDKDLFCLRIASDRELRNHHASETVPDGGEIH